MRGLRRSRPPQSALAGEEQEVDRVCEGGDDERGYGDNENFPRPRVAPDIPGELPELTQLQLRPVQEAGGRQELARDQGEPDDRRAPARAGKQATHGADGHDQDAEAQVEDAAQAESPVTVLLAATVAF